MVRKPVSQVMDSQQDNDSGPSSNTPSAIQDNNSPPSSSNPPATQDVDQLAPAPAIAPASTSNPPSTKPAAESSETVQNQQSTKTAAESNKTARQLEKEQFRRLEAARPARQQQLLDSITEKPDLSRLNLTEFSYLDGEQANLCVMRDALKEVCEQKACGKLSDPGLKSSKGEPILSKRIVEYTKEESKLLRKTYVKHGRCIELVNERVNLSKGFVDEKALRFPQATSSRAEKYAKPFCDFLTENPTVFHAVAALKGQMKEAGWTQLREACEWKIEPGGKYFVERNGSSLISFVVGADYKPGNGAAILAGHVDALTAKLKPISKVPNKAGYLQLGVAPYAGGMNSTWWDRDLGIAGRVVVKKADKITTKLVNLNWPIARIPTLAPHFGAASQGPFNQETQMVPIIGLDNTPSSDDPSDVARDFAASSCNYSFTSTQPPALVEAIAAQLSIPPSEHYRILSWELELYDVQPATLGGLNRELIYGGRIDDKLCSWSAQQALLLAAETDTANSSLIKTVALFDNEEIGSLLRQGARGNFLPATLERAVGALATPERPIAHDTMGRMYARSFLVSSDVTHAVNPNFLNAYLPSHSPRLNTGLVISADSNGHMTTDAVSTAILQQCADKAGATLQLFQIRNDSRSGGTVGPMLSSVLGCRAVDAGLPQLSMHSIRATTGALDPGLGVVAFLAFLNGYEEVYAGLKR